MRQKGNFIKKMMLKSLSYNYLQIKKNNERSLFCNWFIENLKLSVKK